MSVQWKADVYTTKPLRDVIASVIQGEAAKSFAQFAVAAVMQNRLQSKRFGATLEAVVQPSQFNGWQSPTPGAFTIADALIGGTLTKLGTTGNALYYAAPDPRNAAWANPNTDSGRRLFVASNNIGGNHFSDVMGPPTSAFVEPAYSVAPAPALASQPAATAAKVQTMSDPIGAFFQDLGDLFTQHFGDALARVLTPSSPPAAPPAPAETPSTAGPSETDIMLKLAELFLSNFSSFASYATVLPHLATEIPDIVAKGEAAVKGVEQLIADIKAGKVGNAPNDFQAVFTAVEGILNDVGINLGTVTSTVALMPQLPSVQGLQAVPALSTAAAAGA